MECLAAQNIEWVNPANEVLWLGKHGFFLIALFLLYPQLQKGLILTLKRRWEMVN